MRCAAAAGAPRLATGARADAACEFLARAPIKGAALLWFGDTRVTNTPVHAADQRRVECSWAHEQSGVGGGPVLELFEGEASRESGNVTWESFVHGVEIDICCMQQRGTTPHPSPGRPRPPLIPAQVGPDPYPGPVPRLDTPRFPYKAQKQLQAHIKPNPPATKKN